MKKDNSHTDGQLLGYCKDAQGDLISPGDLVQVWPELEKKIISKIMKINGKFRIYFLDGSEKSNVTVKLRRQS